jgi:hypothetical protein
LSRLRIFFLFAALTALATAFAACGGGGGGSTSGDPQQVLDDATLEGIESANLDLSMQIKAEGDEGGTVDVSLSGPFQSEGKGQLPQLGMTVKANGSIGGEDVDFEGGLVLLPNQAYVNYKGVDYEVDPTTFTFVKSAIEQAQQRSGGGSSEGATACQDTVAGLKIGDFVDNLTDEGSADVGGASTTKVSGDLNVQSALDWLIEAVEDPACKSQLGAAGPLPSTAELESAKSEVGNSLKAAHVEVYVGDDNIVRRVTGEISVEPPSSAGGGPEKADVSFDLSLSDVNEDQQIDTPSNPKPLSNLFIELGVNPLELIQGGGLGGTGGLGGLLDEFGGGASEEGGRGEVPGVPSTDAGSQQAYLKCLGSATTPVDLQHCAALLK